MNDPRPHRRRHGALPELTSRYALWVALLVAGGSVVTYLLVTRAGTPQSGGDVDVEREAMRAIGAAAHQWQVYFGDAVCPSIRQLVERKSMSSAARKVDAWEQPYVIRCMDTEVTVSSSGPDRSRNTPDDIVVSVARRK